MSRHRSAAKLVNMSGKQTYDDIVSFMSDELKLNHIVIKIQITFKLLCLESQIPHYF